MQKEAAFHRARGTGGVEFGIMHFAGEIVYNAQEFLDKNRDTLPDQIIDVMASGKMDLVRQLFTSGDRVNRYSRRTGTRASFNLLRMFSVK